MRHSFCRRHNHSSSAILYASASLDWQETMFIPGRSSARYQTSERDNFKTNEPIFAARCMHKRGRCPQCGVYHAVSVSFLCCGQRSTLRVRRSKVDITRPKFRFGDLADASGLLVGLTAVDGDENDYNTVPIYSYDCE